MKIKTKEQKKYFNKHNFKNIPERKKVEKHITFPLYDKMD